MTVYRQTILFVLLLLTTGVGFRVYAADRVGIWMRFEHSFTSTKDYVNPIYEVRKFVVRFTSPTGRIKNINGFWDGGRSWKVRFAPDEKGMWNFESTCSDVENRGLNQVKGSFECTANNSKLTIYQRGAITHPKGSYHLTHADGTPFFWAGCTVWNGTLKSTETEWDAYLSNRAQYGYSIIQFVTTQWRGCDKNSQGQVAFTGSGQIKINPDFFTHLDKKIDKINEHGLVAAPVLLWALGSIQGRDLSPGYYLPEEEAILLAKYMVARYGSHHIIWILGGDGKYTDENEQRWKNIGRAVFKEEHPGLAALHPGGGSWIGEAYASEDWLDIIGYQSGHNNNPKTLDFINKGPVATTWYQLPPRPVINMEPVYEEINPAITATDIRNAGYWSILNGPTSGFTYGADGLWPWLREGETPLNHTRKGKPSSRWNESMKLPGSVQIGYLARFIRTLEWWNLRPAPELLVEQPGNTEPAGFIALSQSTDGKTILAYLPKASPVKLFNLNHIHYEAQWFNPVSNRTSKGSVATHNGILITTPPAENNDFVLILKRKN